MEKIPEIVVAEANRYGCDTVRFSKRWKGYDVYYCGNSNNGKKYSGPPILMYYKDGVLHEKDYETDLEFLMSD